MNFRILSMLTCLIVLYLSGCGEVDEIDPEEKHVVSFVNATPASSATIFNDEHIVLTFDDTPTSVRSSAGVVEAAGRSVTIKGPFIEINEFKRAEGDPSTVPLVQVLNLQVAWADGMQTLTYLVQVLDTDPPIVIESDIKDGDLLDPEGWDFVNIPNVNPFDPNIHAQIVVIFSEVVTGHIALQTEDGTDVGWFGTVEGNKGTLQLVKGKEICCWDHVITGKVSDAAGNELDFKIKFGFVQLHGVN